MEFAAFLILLVLCSQWSARVESASFGALPEGSEIIQCNVVYRHGDRTPIREYPTSKYKDISSWGGIGWGQLTLTGMKQQYRFGRWLMSEYGPSGKKLIQSSYNYKEYNVKSTDVDRTIMSGLANTAGLYRPQLDQQIAYGIDWNPIPIRAIPANSDDVTGMKQQYRFGRWLMSEYGPSGKKLIQSSYNYKEYNVKSTDVDRTIMSGLANTAGLYRPQLDQQIAYGIDWNPIPIRAIPANSDDVIFGQLCPLEKEITTNNLELYFKNLLEEDSDLMDYLEKYSGVEIKKNPTNLFILCDAIKIENITFNEIPEWAQSLYPAPLEEIYLKYFQSYTKTSEQKKLTAGPLLKTIIGNMVDITHGLETSKLYSYSGHDTNVFAILSALGMEPTKLLKYTCAIFFELYRTPSKEYYVQARFRPGPDTTPVSLIIPGCGGSHYCELEHFINITANMIPENLQDECKTLNIRSFQFGGLEEELLSTFF